MRLSGLVLAATLLPAATAGAQQPPQLPAGPGPAQTVAPPAPANPVLDRNLQRWEQEAQRFQTLALTLERNDIDNVTRSATKYSGIAYFMKSGKGPTARNLALLETYSVDPRGAKQLVEKFVCTGTFFYLFNVSGKEVVARELPRAAAGAMPDDNFLGMFGLRAEEAKRRYNLTLDPEDPNFVYIRIKPRFPRDKEEFEEARVALKKDTFLPAQLWYRQPSGKVTVWSIQRVQINGDMKQEWFDKPPVPPGWKFQKIAADADAAPKVFRNSGRP